MQVTVRIMKTSFSVKMNLFSGKNNFITLEVLIRSKLKLPCSPVPLRSLATMSLIQSKHDILLLDYSMH